MPNLRHNLRHNLRKASLFVAVAALLAGCGTQAPAPDPGPTEPALPEAPQTPACATLPETLTTLEVPAGTLCDLVGTTVAGDITVLAGARLTLLGVQVGGSVRGEGAAEVALEAATLVTGDVLVSGGVGASVTDSQVDGSVRLSGNSGDLGVSGATIGGDLEVSRNTGGSAVVDGNVVAGSLACEGNAVPPEGGENQVSGTKIGQCAEL